MRFFLLLVMAVASYGQSTFRFVGTACNVGAISLNTFGQSVLLSAPQALQVVQSRCAIIPDSQFQTVGFTSDELAQWGTAIYNGPDSFQQKVQAARGLWVTYYNATLSGALTVSGAATLSCVNGTACSTPYSVVGGTGPYTWSISTGTLPAGLAIDTSAGTISGTPSATGVVAVTVTVTDANSNTANQSLSITVASNTPPSTGSINFSDEETPAGTIDGLNVTFTLTNSPITGTLKVYLNGLRMKVGVDYTYTASTITFILASAPQATDILLADYRY